MDDILADLPEKERAVLRAKLEDRGIPAPQLSLVLKANDLPVSESAINNWRRKNVA